MSDTNLIIDQTKNYSANFGHIFRSSAIFYIPKNIKTTISVSNYWDFKNNKKISLLFTLRSKSGKLINREEKFFVEKNVVNSTYTFDEDHSVEIEAFGNENLRIPYAAVMGAYETKDSICILHSYSRNHSLIELEDKNCHTIAKESCWTIKPKFKNKAVFHNGHLQVPSQIGELILTNQEGNEKKIEFKIPSIKLYETLIFNVEEIYNDYKSFLNNKTGFATINFENKSNFTRLMLIWEDNQGKEFQATHSNFDYSTFQTKNVKSRQGGKMIIPKSLDDVDWLKIVVYPKFQKGTYSIDHENKKIDFKRGFIKAIEDDSGNPLFFKKDSDEIPSRLISGIQGALKGQIVPFECSTGITHEQTPSKRFGWAMVSGKLESNVYISKVNIDRKNAKKFGDKFVFKLYSSKTNKILEKTIKYNASSNGKYVYKLNEIFEECKDFLGKDFGCISFYDDSRSHLLFTSIKKIIL